MSHSSGSIKKKTINLIKLRIYYILVCVCVLYSRHPNIQYHCHKLFFYFLPFTLSYIIHRYSFRFLSCFEASELLLCLFVHYLYGLGASCISTQQQQPKRLATDPQTIAAKHLVYLQQTKQSRARVNINNSPGSQWHCYFVFFFSVVLFILLKDFPTVQLQHYNVQIIQEMSQSNEVAC